MSPPERLSASRPEGEPQVSARARGLLVVVTGLSGAGKSTALRALEDLGFFCVDNLPTTVLPETLAACDAGGISLVALGIDVRVRSFLGRRRFEARRACGHRNARDRAALSRRLGRSGAAQIQRNATTPPALHACPRSLPSEVRSRCSTA